ncbi:UNVERIFIED_CONTAM: hypothetical protein FKN15_060591 [Acipenser sinensis]
MHRHVQLSGVPENHLDLLLHANPVPRLPAPELCSRPEADCQACVFTVSQENPDILTTQALQV